MNTGRNWLRFVNVSAVNWRLWRRTVARTKSPWDAASRGERPSVVTLASASVGRRHRGMLVAERMALGKLGVLVELFEVGPEPSMHQVRRFEDDHVGNAVAGAIGEPVERHASSQ
jgi:hypothetical protein